MYDPTIQEKEMKPNVLTKNVHSKVVHNSPKLETTQCPSAKKWINQRWHIQQRIIQQYKGTDYRQMLQ